ncbi:MAG TPA: acyl-CoA thioesterase [Bacteroidaceae bacterium]|nr:acyl-CoA thioesterase [Bacteroidaceae bacterium]
MKKDYHFVLPMKVRDYECDLQGIVNNSNYQHYMEHTRHEFLESLGVSFAELHQRGVDAVVARITINFKTPLKSGDHFLSCLSIYKDGIKWIFNHDIYRTSDEKIACKGEVTSVTIVDGKLSVYEDLDHILQEATAQK